MSRDPTDPRVCAFLDLSNIWYGMRAAAAAHSEDPHQVRLHTQNLADVLRGGRAAYSQVAVANADVPQSVIVRFSGIGEVLTRESGRISGTEQANDEALQVRIYETMHANPPGVVVLATGDGAGWQKGHGFIPALEAARTHKWGVELVSWREITNPRSIEWVNSVSGAFVDLNDHYYSVTFEEGGRRAQPISLRRRPSSGPSTRRGIAA